MKLSMLKTITKDHDLIFYGIKSQYDNVGFSLIDWETPMVVIVDLKTKRAMFSKMENMEVQMKRFELYEFNTYNYCIRDEYGDDLTPIMEHSWIFKAIKNEIDLSLRLIDNYLFTSHEVK